VREVVQVKNYFFDFEGFGARKKLVYLLVREELSREASRPRKFWKLRRDQFVCRVFILKERGINTKR